MEEFIKGVTYQEDSDSLITYGITNKTTGHINQIEVHDDEALRDKLLKLLNSRKKNPKKRTKIKGETLCFH